MNAIVDNITHPAGPAVEPEPQPSKPRDGRAETSPRNGAKSHGPKTKDGKDKASRNSLKHGLYSRKIVLATENKGEYDALVASFLDSYQPANFEEHDLVIDMAHARWRIRRVERHEQGLMNLEMSRAMRDAPEEFEAMDAVTLEALAIERLCHTTALENISRLAQRYERTYFRCREALLRMRRERGLSEAPPDPQPATADSIAEPVSNEPTSPPPPPRQPSPNRPRQSWWSRWLSVMAVPILAALLFFAANPSTQP
ncbi:MAG: hypothetical protein JNK87_34720 [Bryobacterales bacterium]|nr:hypothetical protein [Bryobacterales bacterium]